MTNTKPPEDMTMPQQLSDKAYQNKKERNAKYAAEHTTRVVLNLNHKTDSDIIAYLQTVTNKQGLIKELIRARMTDEEVIKGLVHNRTKEGHTA